MWENSRNWLQYSKKQNSKWIAIERKIRTQTHCPLCVGACIGYVFATGRKKTLFRPVYIAGLLCAECALSLKLIEYLSCSISADWCGCFRMCGCRYPSPSPYRRHLANGDGVVLKWVGSWVEPVAMTHCNRLQITCERLNRVLVKALQ